MTTATRIFSTPRILIRQFERRLVHCRALLAQRQDLILPVVLGIKPREARRERRVMPAPREPPGVMDHAQRAQRLDQRQFGWIEIMKFAVTRDHLPELRTHRITVT